MILNINDFNTTGLLDVLDDDRLEKSDEYLTKAIKAVLSTLRPVAWCYTAAGGWVSSPKCVTLCLLPSFSIGFFKPNLNWAVLVSSKEEHLTIEVASDDGRVVFDLYPGIILEEQTTYYVI